MNKGQLAALTETERLMVKTAKNIGLKGVVQLLTALADARLEVARLKKLRDEYDANCVKADKMLRVLLDLKGRYDA